MIGMSLLTTGASFLKDSGPYMEGLMAENVAEVNAAITRKNADVFQQEALATLLSANIETEKMQQSGRRFKAAQLAAFASSGAEISSGTPLAVMEDQAGEIAMDILQFRRNALIQSQKLETKASFERYRAKLTEYQGDQARRAGALGSVRSVMGSVGTGVSMLTGLG